MQKKIPEYSNYPIPYLDIERYKLDKQLIQKFTREELIEFQFLPLDKFDNILTVCVCNPSLDLINDIEAHTGKIIRIFWCEEAKLIKIINNISQYIFEEEISWKG